ncbi:MAG: SCO family protein [Gammaproteobacteria bacterium]|nr:MAG: SCO family protein [Gammaproteobacteria bacterium]
MGPCIHAREEAMPPLLRFSLPALAVIGLALFGVHQLRSGGVDEELTLATGTVLKQRAAVADFELVDQTGRPFTRNDLKNRWSLLFAGFTHCPDICPTTLALLARLEHRLQEAGAPLQVVFLSVDPERDTPDQMAEYLGYFSPSLRGATGDAAQIRALSDSLGLAYVRVPESRGHYSVDHSSALVLIDPDARMAGHFRPPLDLDGLTRDLARL